MQLSLLAAGIGVSFALLLTPHYCSGDGHPNRFFLGGEIVHHIKHDIFHDRTKGTGTSFHGNS